VTPTIRTSPTGAGGSLGAVVDGAAVPVCAVSFVAVVDGALVPASSADATPVTAAVPTSARSDRLEWRAITGTGVSRAKGLVKLESVADGDPTGTRFLF
jgi:hypothetical protein